MLRMSILTEITCKEYRNFFINIQFTSGLIASNLISLYKVMDLSWKTYYSVGALFMFLFLIPFIIFFKTNPVYYLVHNKFDLCLEASLKFMSINNISNNLITRDSEKLEKLDKSSINLNNNETINSNHQIVNDFIESYENQFNPNKASTSDDENETEEEITLNQNLDEESFIFKLNSNKIELHLF